jgi:ubiquitin-protein ligase
MTSLGIRRFYNRWTRLTKEKHILLSVNSTFKAFETSSVAIANQYQIIFQDERAYRIKISAIEKLIKASQGTTQNYLIKWRDNVREYNMMNSMDK